MTKARVIWCALILAIASLQVASVNVSWDYSPALVSTGLISFNVYDSADLKNWTLRTNIIGYSVTFTNDSPAKFFRVEVTNQKP